MSKMVSRQNRDRDQASHSRKQQTAIPDSVHRRLSYQNTNEDGSLSSKVRLPSMQTVQPIRTQPPNRQRRWKLSPMPSAGLPQELTVGHTCHHPHRFNELATKSEKWNGKPRAECDNGQHPPSKTPVGELPWTCLSEGK